jgi:hypothetical protein
MAFWSVLGQWHRRSFGLLLLVAMFAGIGPTASANNHIGLSVSSEAGTPMMTLDPSSGPCPMNVTVYGSGFAPGVQVNFELTRDRDGAVTAANSQSGGPPAEADGTLLRTIPLVGCDAGEPIGSTFTITMYEYDPNAGVTRGPSDSATFTVAAPLPGLPNTGGGWAAHSSRSLWRLPHLCEF